MVSLNKVTHAGEEHVKRASQHCVWDQTHVLVVGAQRCTTVSAVRGHVRLFLRERQARQHAGSGHVKHTLHRGM